MFDNKEEYESNVEQDLYQPNAKFTPDIKKEPIPTNAPKYFGGCVVLFVVFIVLAAINKSSEDKGLLTGVFLLCTIAFWASVISAAKWVFKKVRQ